MSREQKLIFAKEKLKQFQNKKNTTKSCPQIPSPDSTKESPVTGIRNLVNTLKYETKESSKDIENQGKANNDYLLSLTEQYASKNDELYRQLNDAHLKITELDEINSRLKAELQSGQGTNAAHNAAQEDYIRTIGDLVAENTELTSKLSLAENRLGVIESQLKCANIKARTAEQSIVSFHTDNNRLTSENEQIKKTQRGYQQQFNDKDAELTRLRDEAHQRERTIERYKSENEKKSLQLIQYEAELKNQENNVANLKLARENEVQMADALKYDTLMDRYKLQEAANQHMCQKLNILMGETCGTDIGDINGGEDIDMFCRLFTVKVRELVDVAQNMEKMTEGYKSENSELRQMVEFQKETHFKLTEQCKEAVSMNEDSKLDCDLIRYQRSGEYDKLVQQVDELTQTVKDLTLHLESKSNLVDSLQIKAANCDTTRLLEIVDELETQNRAISRYVVLYRQQRHVLNDKISAKDKDIELYQERLAKVRFLVESLLNRPGNELDLETADSILKLAGESSVEGMGTDEMVEQISETLKVCDLSVVGHLPIDKLCKDCKGPIYIA